MIVKRWATSETPEGYDDLVYEENGENEGEQENGGGLDSNRRNTRVKVLGTGGVVRLPKGYVGPISPH